MPVTVSRWTRPGIGLAAVGLLILACAASILLADPSGITTATTGTRLQEWLAGIQGVQRDLHRDLAAALREVSRAGIPAAWPLIMLSGLYGVFHAAGPGHGKAVMATYLTTQDAHLGRGIVLSVVSSLFQGAVAIVLIETVLGVVGMSMRRAQATSVQFEAVSFGLLVLLGVMLMVTHGRRLLRQRQAGKASQAAAPSIPMAAAPSMFASGGQWKAVCDDCGSFHAPTAEHLRQPLSARHLVGVVLAIGLRPCSGAVLVLLVAHALDLRWAGIAAVVAMSLGTALTVSMLAVVSVLARRIALRLIGGNTRAAWANMALSGVGVLGGAAICVMGLALLGATLAAPAHPLF
ncbi:nickel/cobalt efflux system [Pigmentiphaga litoralis]|uniref:nickel/cobalt transporter n=1 Tax=Pigmentiphaga litoralis TaxID=516702 RepID=UPI001678710D|nr:nickel/cobalt transporter [Pigmentiphaga litoralis]GGX09988.1 nickel/cobalt efflux system [Pigmentiphaga litoralis]